MTASTRNAIVASVGIAIVAGHLAGFAALAARSAGTDLEVDLAAPLASPQLALDGIVPAAIAARVTTTVDAPGPGLRRKRWSVDYRGGFVRGVGATQLVGPFQDPDALACSGRVVIGQRLLDDGHAGPGTIAGVMMRMIDAQLKGMEVFPIGTYERIAQLGLRWARVETSFIDRDLIGPNGAPHGYMRVTASIVFSRVTVPLVLVLVPEQVDGTAKLHFRAALHADVTFDNRAVQWLGDKLPLDKLATRIASHELDDMLVTTLAPPPPFAIDDAQALVFTYCKDPVEIIDGAFGALPFAVVIGRVNNAPEILPPHFEHAAPKMPTTATIAAIDLDIDALDAMLFELWRTGWLDRQLASVGLDRRFNADPIVTEYLAVRLSPIRLALPPVIEPAGDHLRLAADARVAIGEDLLDASRVTTGRVYGALDFHIGDRLALAVDLGALELACERPAPVGTRLVPCYADLVAALADRGAEFHGALTEAFGKILTAIFVERHLATGELPAELTIHRATPTLAPGARGLHLELDASLAQTR